MITRPEGILLILSFMLMPLISGTLLYNTNKKAMMTELVGLCDHVITHINAEQHQQLSNSNKLDVALQQQLLTDLSIIHLGNPKIKYIYTITEQNDQWLFILDTLQNNAVYKTITERHPGIIKSDFKEIYNTPAELIAGIELLKSGQKSFVNSSDYSDIYGNNIGCLARIEKNNEIIGYLGIDYHAGELARLEQIIFKSAGIGIIISAIFLLFSMGYLRSNFQEKQALIYKLDQLSLTDSLTNIKNRRAFFISSEELLNDESLGRYKSVAILDLDHFKKINDHYGHRAGDDTLVKFASLLLTLENRNTSIGRIGGEEFGICSVSDNEKTINISLDHIREILSKNLIDTENNTFSITFSAGVMTTTKNNLDINILLPLADDALYKAKNSGRNKTVTINDDSAAL